MILNFPRNGRRHFAETSAGERRSCILASASYVTPRIPAADAPAITRSQYSTGIDRLRFCSPTVDAPLPMTRAKAELPPNAEIRASMLEGESVIVPRVYRLSVDAVNRITVDKMRDTGDMGDSNDRLKEARKRAKFGSARSAALRFGWNPSTYASHENGQTPVPVDAAARYAKAFRVSKGWILTGDGPMAAQTLIPLMGRIGAGGDIDPEYEQVPEGGLDNVDLPVSVGVDAIAFEVTGDSMLPRYENGDMVVCSASRRDPADYVGRTVAVRTVDGKRYLKMLRLGSRRGTYTLESFNSTPIADVKIAWIGEILAIVPASRLNGISKRKAM